MNQNRKAWFVVIVAALGYFVDIFDIALFSITRVPSLQALGLSGDALMSQGMLLLNIQMFGMLVGGLAWGAYGDRRGRIEVLFGSILTYSIANLLNAFVTSVPQYAVLRFIAGFGLAGELGAGITLATESLPRDKRGIGTTVIATVGVLGAMTASYTSDHYSWRTAYVVGGVLGFLLLLCRAGALESGLFAKVKESSVVRGSVRYAFATRERVVRCWHCLAVGLPIYFVAGVLVAFAPEVSTALGFRESFSAGEAVFCSYLGFFFGDVSSGLVSQYLRSRIKTLVFFTVGTFIMALVILFSNGLDKPTVKTLYIILGSFAGYWAIFVTVAAEQFGTNIRATMATSIPNFVRASTIPITAAITLMKPQIGLKYAAIVVLLVCTGLALYSMTRLQETFSKDLDYVE
jgi:MFS family permease